MKAVLSNHVKFFLVIAVVLFLSGSTLYAYEEFKLTETQIENLINGIESENDGVKKSSIYLAGQYQIEEAFDALIETLETESDYSVILMVVFSMFQINEYDALTAVLDFTAASNDEKLDKMLIITAVEFYKNNDQLVFNTVK